MDVNFVVGGKRVTVGVTSPGAPVLCSAARLFRTVGDRCDGRPDPKSGDRCTCRVYIQYGIYIVLQYSGRASNIVSRTAAGLLYVNSVA